MSKNIEQLQNSLQRELDNYKIKQKELEKNAVKRQQLDALLNETSSVMVELDLLKDDAEVYKLTGPVLIKQDVEEAKVNVKKRTEYLKGELKRMDGIIQALEKKQDSHRETLTNLQKSLQEATLKQSAS